MVKNRESSSHDKDFSGDERENQRIKQTVIDECNVFRVIKKTAHHHNFLLKIRIPANYNPIDELERQGDRSKTQRQKDPRKREENEREGVLK